MAFDFDASTDYVRIEDAAALTLQDSDWEIGGLVKMNATAMDGATSRKVITWNYNAGPDANGPFLDLYIETSGASRPYDIACDLDLTAAAGGNTNIVSTSKPFQSNTDWTFVSLARVSGALKIHVGGTEVASGTFDSAAAINCAVPFYLGSRDSHNRLFDGQMAEWAKWDRALSAEERTALSKGFAPSFFQNSLAWYLPMIREYAELKAGLTVTNNGTIVAPHPAIIYPSGPYTIQAPVTAGETHEFEGSQTVSFDGTAALKQSAAFTGDATVNMDGTADTVLNEWRMAGAETVSFDGTADTIRNHWLMTGAEEVSFDGSAALKQSAALAGGETVSFDGEAALDIAALLFEGQGLLSFDGSIATVNAILKMQAAQSISFDGQAQLGQEAIFEGGASLSFDGLANLTAFEWDAVDAATTPTWQDVD